MNIESSVIDILSRIKPSSTLYVPENYSEPLTGKKMGFNGRDMVYLYFEICYTFNLQFTKNDVENYGFNSIARIIHLIEEKSV